MNFDLQKDAYWFPHDSNAKDDEKCLILIEELGLEGYGIFWVLVETLRDQKNFQAPIRILPALARRYNTSLEKMKAVVTRYDLFQVVDEKFFFSESLKRRMQPMIDSKKQARIDGIKGNLIRYGYATIDELDGMSPEEIIRFNDNKQQLIGSGSGGDSGPDRNNSTVQKKTEQDINIPFVDFWDAYSKKVGSKSKAEKYWNELSDDQRDTIMDGIDAYISTFEDSQFQPYPTTFLNQKRWEAESYGQNEAMEGIKLRGV